MLLKSAKRYLLIGLGFLFLIFGVVGVFIPVLPTTPFLLLSSFCFLRSSNRLYNWLIHHKLFGSYIYNYLTYRAVKRSAKIGALIFLWTSLTISAILVHHLHVRLILLVVGIGVSIHLLLLKTLHTAKPEESGRATSSALPEQGPEQEPEQGLEQEPEQRLEQEPEQG